MRDWTLLWSAGLQGSFPRARSLERAGGGDSGKGRGWEASQGVEVLDALGQGLKREAWAEGSRLSR